MMGNITDCDVILVFKAQQLPLKGFIEQWLVLQLLATSNNVKPWPKLKLFRVLVSLN